MLLNYGVGEDSWESLGLKEIKPVDPKGNQSWIFPGRTDAEAETPVLWPPDAKSWLLGKDPDAGKDCRQEMKRITEDEMAGWHHWLNGHEFEWILGVCDRQGSLACCSPWGHKESDETEWLNWLKNWFYSDSRDNASVFLTSKLKSRFFPTCLLHFDSCSQLQMHQHLLVL